MNTIIFKFLRILCLNLNGCHSHKFVAYWEGTQINAPVQRDPYAGVAFRGRSYRLNGNQTRTPEQAQTRRETETETQQPNSPEGGIAFRGTSYRLGDAH